MTLALLTTDQAGLPTLTLSDACPGNNSITSALSPASQVSRCMCAALFL